MREQLADNFYRDEFRCHCGCGFDRIDILLVEQLQRFRDLIYVSTGVEIPISVTCGCRCLPHNKAVGGTDKSFHTKGIAGDITFGKRLPVLAAGRIAYLGVKFGFIKFGAIGVYPDRNFIHLDIRPGKRLVTWVNTGGVYRYNVDFSQEIKTGIIPAEGEDK